MKVGLVSGDGLAVSGLLTVFRNVMEIAWEQGLAAREVPTDLGTSWRPDKAAFFPEGDPSWRHPDWMVVARNRQIAELDRSRLGAELMALRSGVAELSESPAAERDLEASIRSLTVPYEKHFSEWYSVHGPDWVFALNMTLSDAVPATLGFQSASNAYFLGRRGGGVVYWDHDLFGSYSVREPSAGRVTRVYPESPNKLTPLPRGERYVRWIVPSEQLANEARSYPTDIAPTVMPNVLPTLPPDSDRRVSEFLQQHAIERDRPLLLNAVRLFHVKGAHVAIDLLAALKRISVSSGRPVPYLLIFGSLREDPEYSARVVDRARDLGVAADVRFLDGVPVSSLRRDGSWYLDERDLLAAAKASAGAVVFTPSVRDVESVGLGPALAAVAGIPSIVTPYNAFSEIYGDDFPCVVIEGSPAGIEAGARRVSDRLACLRERPQECAAELARASRIVSRRFPRAPWETFWRELAAGAQA